jgi:serine/threonine protein phosphatase PrpC
MTNTARAAQRARLLADIVRERALLHPDADILEAIAESLDIAAVALDRAEPTVEGVAIVDHLPRLAITALWDVTTLAGGLPAHTLPLPVIDYITAPAGGYLPELEPVGTPGSHLARQADDIRTRLAAVGRHLDWDNDDIMRTDLDNFLKLHSAYVRIAASVEVMAALLSLDRTKNGPAMYVYSAAQLTGTRARQCDATAAFTNRQTRAFSLLDGIGSSQAVRDWTRQTARYLARTGAERGDAESALRTVHAVAAAQYHNWNLPEDMPSAVAVLAVASPGKPLTVAWCGDARAYITTPAGDLARLTVDHNVRQWVLAQGRTPEPHARNQVISCIGSDEPDPLLGSVTVPAYGRLLLVSDGAYEPIEDAGEDLADYLTGTTKKAAVRIVTRAVANATGKALGENEGRADNATALVVDLEPHPAALPAWEETPAEVAALDRAYWG